MEQEFSFIIEEEVYEKFYLAVHLAKEDEGKAGGKRKRRLLCQGK